MRWTPRLVGLAMGLMVASAAVAAPPELLTGFSATATDVLVKFDVPVTAATATNLSNYALASLGSVDAATLDAPNVVRLTVTSSLLPGDLETLTVAGVADSAGGSPMPTPQSVSFHFGVVSIADIQAPDPGALADSCADRSRFAGPGDLPGDPITFVAVTEGPYNSYTQAVMSDTSGAAMRGGLFVNCPMFPVYPGVVYRITGRVLERGGETVLKSVTYRESLYVTSRPPLAFELHPGAPGAVADSGCDALESFLTGEDYEGCFVHLDGLRIWRVDPLHERFVVGPEGNPSDTVGVLNLNSDTHYPYDVGRRLDLTGAVVFREGRFWIAPRSHGEIAVKDPDLVLHGLEHWVFGGGKFSVTGPPAAETLKVVGLAGDGRDGIRVKLPLAARVWSGSVSLGSIGVAAALERLSTEVSCTVKQGDPDIEMLSCEREATERSRNVSTGTQTGQRSQENDTKDVADKVAASDRARAKKRSGKGIIVNTNGGEPTFVDFDSDRDTTYLVDCESALGQSPVPQTIRVRLEDSHPVVEATWTSDVLMSVTRNEEVTTATGNRFEWHQAEGPDQIEAMTVVQLNVWNAASISLWGEATDPIVSVGSGPVAPRAHLRVATNPSAGRVRLMLDQPAAGPVELELFDVSGRRLQHWAFRDNLSGTRTLDWEPGRLGVAPRSGVLFARATGPGGVSTARFVFLR